MSRQSNLPEVLPCWRHARQGILLHLLNRSLHRFLLHLQLHWYRPRLDWALPLCGKPLGFDAARQPPLRHPHAERDLWSSTLLVCQYVLREGEFLRHSILRGVDSFAVDAAQVQTW